MNITCPKCRHRHPANRSCEEAKRLADEAMMKRHAEEQRFPLEEGEQEQIDLYRVREKRFV